MPTLCGYIGRLPSQRLASLALALLAACAMAAAQPTGCYIGAYIEQDPVVAGDIELFERLVGKEQATYMCYLGYGEPFPSAWAGKVIGYGALPHIAWEPNNGLEEVQDDAYLRRWAQAAAQTEAPILLRFASEMNGTWMPYSGNPDQYVEKWRLVYRVIKEVAPNVIMVWCPFATPRRTIPLYYPGDDYVDWVGVNIYAVLYNDGDLARPAPDDQIDNLRYVYDLYGARKPIAICEYAATHHCTASQQLASGFASRKMREMYQAVRGQFPSVVLLNWFSVDAASDGLARNDYAVTTDNLVLDTYRELIADEYFLAQLEHPEQLVATRPTRAPPLPGTAVPLALAGSSLVGDGQIAIVVRGSRPEAVTGRVTIEALVGSGLDVYLVEFYLDSRFLGLTNVSPYRTPWNAHNWEPGAHIIRVVVRDTSDREVAVHEAAVVVAEPRVH